MEVATASRRRVYACAETYAEPTLVLADGISVFGNLACKTPEWGTAPEHAVLQATVGPAARATGITAETRIEGIDLIAPAGITPGESSIGLVAENASGLHFVRARIAANAGANGVQGIQLEQDAAFDGANERAQYACENSAFSCVSAPKPAGGVGVCIGAPAPREGQREVVGTSNTIPAAPDELSEKLHAF